MTEFLTLDEAALLVPGFDADALKRLFRRDILTCYKPGKRLLTTKADVLEAVKVKCRVEPKGRACGSVPPGATVRVRSRTSQHGSSSTALAKSALDLALTRLPKKKSRH